MPPSDDLHCRDLVELASDHLDGALGDAERRRVDAHLARCDGCSTYMAQLRATVEAIGRLERPGLPPGSRERLLSAFRGRER